MIVAIGIPCPSATYGSTTIYATVVARFVPVVNEVATPSHPVASRFIACSKHAERRVVAILTHHALSFLQQIMVDSHTTTQLHTMVRP